MITVLQGKTQKVEISPEGPTVITGDRLKGKDHYATRYIRHCKKSLQKWANCCNWRAY